jgi:phage/plasmid-associated DNA primase
MPLSEVRKNNFAAGKFYRARGWIASETGKHKEAIGTDFIKLTSGNGVIDGDRKNQDRISFEPYFQTVVDTNTMPRIDDGSKGWIERFVKADLPYTFLENPDPENPLERVKDPDLFDKLTTAEELAGILNLLLFRSKAIGKSKTIHKRAGSEMFAEYNEQSSSVSTFLELFCDYTEDLIGIRTPSEPIYEMYKEWCGYKVGEVVDIRYFGRALKRLCGGREANKSKDKDRKTIRTYTGLIFYSSECEAAIQALRLSMSPNVSVKSPLSLHKEKEGTSHCIAMSPLSPLKLWNNILEKFGAPSNVQNCTMNEFSSLRKKSCKITETTETTETSIAVDSRDNSSIGDLMDPSTETSQKDQGIKADLERAEARAQEKEAHDRELTSKYSSPSKHELAVIYILSDIPQFAGVDGLNHGPFRPDEVVSLPERHAQNLIKSGKARAVNSRPRPGPSCRIGGPSF